MCVGVSVRMWVVVCFALAICVFIGLLLCLCPQPLMPITATCLSFWQLAHSAHHSYLPFDLVSICPSLFLISSVARFMPGQNTSSQGSQLFSVKLSYRFLTDSLHMGRDWSVSLRERKINSLMGKWLWLPSLSSSPSFLTDTLFCPLTALV